MTLKDYEGLRCFEIVQILAERMAKLKNITLLLDAVAIGYYGDGILGVVQKGKLIRVHTKKLIIATGAYERPLIFGNNDLPGIYGGRTVLELLNNYGVKPGKRALVVGADDVSLVVAHELLEAGVELAGIIDAGAGFNEGSSYMEKLKARGVVFFSNHSIAEAHGKNSVHSVTLVQIDEKGNVIENSRKKLYCDTICIACNLQPNYDLSFHTKCEMAWSPESKSFVPLYNQCMETSVTGVYVAGDAAGIRSAGPGMIEGRIAGISSALSLGYRDEGQKKLKEYWKTLSQIPKKNQGPRIHLSDLIRGKHRNFVCMCGDVTVGDVFKAIDEGYDDIEVLKRYLGPGTGPCQGKNCLSNLAMLLAWKTGRPIHEIHIPTLRPPIEPVSFGTLAGGVYDEK